MLMKQEMMGWQWHQLDHMQIIDWTLRKSLIELNRSLRRQITTQAPHHSFFTGRMFFLKPNQQRQSTEGTQWQ